MTCKAYNGRCVLENLALELGNALAGAAYPNHQRLTLAAVCMCPGQSIETKYKVFTEGKPGRQAPLN